MGQQSLVATPASLAADKAYSEGALPQLLEERNLTVYILTPARQAKSMVAKVEFE